VHIHIEVSGGIGGLRLRGTLDSEDLPPDVRDLVATALTPDRVEASAARAGEPVPDERQWRVSIGTDTFELVESRSDPDQVEALDALTTTLIRQRRSP
jgi:hypothetical protein